jgi:hypothetical protein
MLNRHFQKVVLHGDFYDQDLPILMIGNHFSWWDGFIAYYLNFRITQRKFHIMMLEDQLAGRKFLNKAGAFSIKKGSRSVIESLQYSSELLSEDDNIVVIYPQGEFQSIHHKSVSFEKGIQFIAARVRNRIHLMFYVALVDYFSFIKPSLTIYYREVDQELLSMPPELETEYNHFLEECSRKQMPG